MAIIMSKTWRGYDVMFKTGEQGCGVLVPEGYQYGCCVGCFADKGTEGF